MSLQDQIQGSLVQSVLVSQSTRPILLSKVEFQGADFTDSYYESLVSPLTTAANPIQLAQLNRKLGGIQSTLLHTGLFKQVYVNVDLAKGVATNGSTIPVDASFKLEQLPLYKFSSATKTTDTSAALGFRYLDPNLLKKACSLLVDVNINYDPINKAFNSKVWDLTLLKPLDRFPQTRAIVNPVISSTDATTWASHEQYSAGVLLGLQSTKFHTCCTRGTGIFTTGISFLNRQVRNVSNTASDSIRAHAGSDFKLGANFNYKFDSRDTIGQFSTGGMLLDFTNELAGYNSADVFADNSSHTPLESFNKTVLRLQTFKSLFNNAITAEVDLESGVIFQNSCDSIPLVDRFTLGGLSSLRGFQLNSVGLKDGDDFIGGSSTFRANLSLYSRLPNVAAARPLRLHAFANIGDVFDFKNCSEFKEYAKSGDLLTNSAFASGVGLVYRGDNALVDLSYNIPLNVRSNDVANPGFGFSVALKFA